ncbi:MAG TPA: hypothetical protein VK506_04045, partial [Conexibacter sp.]|nr:hypothetical protein [Conexibacter sp.]
MLAVALMAGLALVPTAGGATGDADGPRIKPVTALLQFDVVEHPNGACNAGAYWEYFEVNGATSYSIQFLDSGREVTYTQPPFDTGMDATAPRGRHRAGLTGYSASAGGCGDPIPGWRARFQLVRAWATVELRDGTIVGRVTFNSKPLKGIVVSAVGPNPHGPGGGPPYPRQSVFQGVTRADGRYRIHIPKNKTNQGYTVGPLESGYWAPTQYVNKLAGRMVTVDFALARIPPRVADT